MKKSSKKIFSFLGILSMSLQLNCTRNIKGTIEYLDKKRKEINTTKQAQEFIDNLKYDYEDGNINLKTGELNHYEVDSPRMTLKEEKAHCLEGALLAAYLLEDDGYGNLILKMHNGTYGHAVYIYKKDNLWGAIGQSRKPYLKGREPKYKTVQKLVDSYNDAIEKNCPKEKRKFSISGLMRPPRKYGKDWAIKKTPLIRKTKNICKKE